MKLTKTLFLAGASVLLVSVAQAAFTIDLTGNNAYDDENPLLIPFIDSGNSATISLVPTGGSFNSNSGDFGIDDDQINGTSEIVTITFNEDILFNFIDFGGVGADASDGVSFSIGGSITNLFTGVTGFNGSSDIYTPTSPVALATGESIIITGSSTTSIFDIQNFNVTVVPEPSTYALLAGILALTSVMLRRR